MKVRELFITSENRPKIKIIPQWLTIHNTDNTAPAINERNNIQNNVNPDPDKRKSFNWVVDAKEAINTIPENEKAFHAGSKIGNLTSIGMEITEPSDRKGIKSPEWPVIYANSVWLAADILIRNKLSISKLRTHKSWSGKECPRLLLPIWDSFVRDVNQEMIKRTVKSVSVTVKLNGIKLPAKAKLEGSIVLIMVAEQWIYVADFAKALGASKEWDEKNKIVKLVI